MRYRMSLLLGAMMACQEKVPVQDGASTGDDTPVEQIVDNDGDGYGRPVAVHKDGYVELLPPRGAEDDCNDGDDAIYPGAEAPDVACTGPLWEDAE